MTSEILSDGQVEEKNVKTTDSKTTDSKTTKNDKNGKIVAESDNTNHRSRVRARFLSTGGENFSDYELLELLLFYCIPRKDTKAIAKRLISDFGSMAGVFEAEPPELTQYSGISDIGSALLKLPVSLFRQYTVDKISEGDKHVFAKLEDVGEYMHGLLHGYTKEVIFAMFLDSSLKLIYCTKLAEGNFDEVNINNREIFKLALLHKATRVVLSHNHIDGSTVPSSDDIDTTNVLRNDLRVIDVTLADHIIVTPTGYSSMNQGGYFV